MSEYRLRERPYYGRLVRRIKKVFKRQTDFAWALGCHDSVVSRVVRGQKKLSPAERERWESMLHVKDIKTLFRK